jgi:hypothetical protein
VGQGAVFGGVARLLGGACGRGSFLAGDFH